MMRAKADAEAKAAAAKLVQERKRNVVVLCQRFLLDYGYVNAVSTLANESNVSLEQMDAADNIDLGSIVQDFEEYYEMKFGRRPRLVRKVQGFEPDARPAANGRGSSCPTLPKVDPSGGSAGRRTSSRTRPTGRPPKPPV